MDTCRLENPIGGLAAMTVLLVAAALPAAPFRHLLARLRAPHRRSMMQGTKRTGRLRT